MTSIIKFSHLSNSQIVDCKKAIKDIFYESSSVKKFKDIEHKDQFFQTWCGDYLFYYPDCFYLLMEENKLMGYLSGCFDSLSSRDHLKVPGFEVFHDLFQSYPGHLHINFHADARNKGLGSILVNHFIFECQTKNIRGLHLVTSPDSKNVTFYRRLGFNFEVTRDFNNTKLLFMGRDT